VEMVCVMACLLAGRVETAAQERSVGFVGRPCRSPAADRQAVSIDSSGCMAGVREPLRGSRKARVRPPRRTQTWRANAHRARHSIASQRRGRGLRTRADELLWISAPGARLREGEKWGGERSCCRSASRSRSPSTYRPGAVARASVRAIRLRDARTAPDDLHSPCLRPRG
jgi:hypothetical protein